MIRIALLIAAATLLPILIAQLPYSASADSPILAQVATSTVAVFSSTTTIAAMEAIIRIRVPDEQLPQPELREHFRSRCGQKSVERIR